MSAITDPIADMLTRIRNAHHARREDVTIPASKLKAAVARILKREGYISDFAVEGDKVKKVLKVQLKYAGTIPVITGIRRISKPGGRRYTGAKEKMREKGMGITILSTSRGLMTAVEARRMNVGGEILCNVW